MDGDRILYLFLLWNKTQQGKGRKQEIGLKFHLKNTAPGKSL